MVTAQGVGPQQAPPGGPDWLRAPVDRWIVDCDPGIDDAAALLAILGARRLGRPHALDVAGITTVFGNVPLAQATRNALAVQELVGASVPVYPGASRALLEPPRHAREVHGQDGLGDVGLVAEPRRGAEAQDGVSFIVEAARRWGGRLGILALGPLTNLALAVAWRREVAGAISRLVVMGGTSQARGNASAVAEFNVAADPEAAAVVFGAGIPTVIVPWETTVDAPLEEPFLRQLDACPAPAARFMAKAARHIRDVERVLLGKELTVLPDLVAAAVAMQPEVAMQVVAARVEVETAGRVGRGLLALDTRPGAVANALVVLAVDRRRVGELLMEGACPPGRAAEVPAS